MLETHCRMAGFNYSTSDGIKPEHSLSRRRPRLLLPAYDVVHATGYRSFVYTGVVLLQRQLIATALAPSAFRAKFYALVSARCARKNSGPLMRGPRAATEYQLK
eukprot:IDg10874t1